MLHVFQMNYESLMYDQSEGLTCNGIPAGYLHRSYPHIVGGDGKPPPIDVQKIVETFHKEADGKVTCMISGLASDGINFVDGNLNNFLITNLQPVNKEEIAKQEFRMLPKVSITRTFQGTKYDLDVELHGVPAFLVKDALDKLVIPEIPSELGLAYMEAELIWLWNHMTKTQLLKGLTVLSAIDKQKGTKVSLTNRAALTFVLQVLQNPYKEQK